MRSIHGCTIGDGSLVGIGAIVLNDARVDGSRRWWPPAPSSRKAARVGPRQLVAGAPATVKKEMAGNMMERLERAAAQYMKLSRTYLDQHI
jgi:carbonic anhydrase/acetyltransferase-like protein (isoleucine patch superfamily)